MRTCIFGLGQLQNATCHARLHQFTRCAVCTCMCAQCAREAGLDMVDRCRGVRSHIGAFAAPDVIHWTQALPKTRSGKIMRRILRKAAAKQFDQLGDTSTLADPSVIRSLL